MNSKQLTTTVFNHDVATWIDDYENKGLPKIGGYTPKTLEEYILLLVTDIIMRTDAFVVMKYEMVKTILGDLQQLATADLDETLKEQIEMFVNLPGMVGPRAELMDFEEQMHKQVDQIVFDYMVNIGITDKYHWIEYQSLNNGEELFRVSFEFSLETFGDPWTTDLTLHHQVDDSDWSESFFDGHCIFFYNSGITYSSMINDNNE